MDIELLTTSAGDYAESKGRRLSDYQMIGLQCKGLDKEGAEFWIRHEAFMKRCSAVVDLRYSVKPGREASFWNIFDMGEYAEYIISGTGLKLK